jgi:hypothetical protein
MLPFADRNLPEYWIRSPFTPQPGFERELMLVADNALLIAFGLPKSRVTWHQVASNS